MMCMYQFLIIARLIILVRVFLFRVLQLKYSSSGIFNINMFLRIFWALLSQKFSLYQKLANEPCNSSYLTLSLPKFRQLSSVVFFFLLLLFCFFLLLLFFFFLFFFVFFFVFLNNNKLLLGKKFICKVERLDVKQLKSRL